MIITNFRQKAKKKNHNIKFNFHKMIFFFFLRFWLASPQLGIVHCGLCIVHITIRI